MKVMGVVGEGLVELGLEPAPDREVVLGFGGDACNAAVMASRLGCRTRIGGRVGDDALDRRLLAFWESEGIETGHVVVDPDGPTGIYVNERGSEGLHQRRDRRAGACRRVRDGCRAAVREDGRCSRRRRVRVFAGYAGSGPGQLEQELAENAWIVAPAEAQDVFAEDTAGLWSAVLRRLGGPYAVLAQMPPDPRVN